MRKLTRAAQRLWRDFVLFWDLRALLLSFEIETLLRPRLPSSTTHHNRSAKQ